MKFDGSIRAVLVGFGVLMMSAPAVAQSMADIHDQRRERGVICFSDHFHYGSSSGIKTKHAAEIAAIKSWADFVDFEYGGAWTDWRISGSKKIKCSQAGINGPWSCDVSSRPCHHVSRRRR
jgi:hypothetical protein